MPVSEDPHALNQPGVVPHAPEDDGPEELRKGQDAAAWLQIIDEAEKAFCDYQDRADNVDKLYADLAARANNARDREFALFWANVQTLGPSIYSRPPVPVVVPRFKDRRPLFRLAADLLERCAVVAFELTDIDGVMLQVRDDLAIAGRGVPWVRKEDADDSRTGTEAICVEHIDRKDFLHEPARKWAEVGWVARRAWLTRREARERFGREAGDCIAFEERRDDKAIGGADATRQAPVWEVWSKRDNRVLWVSKGCPIILDSTKPRHSLEGFYPCPRPAYATTQRRSLVPVPDIVFYRDQLEEINDATRRIHALTEALVVKGFYPAGQGDVGEAVETALKLNDDRQIMVPIANWAAFGGAGGDVIIWLPIEQVANTITALIAIRKQLIEDVYQITGLSDIMRGQTEASETATAQQLKSQYGSVRVRDRQAELVRIARDLVRIAAEIMAEDFDPKTLIAMSQIEIPTDADIAEQAQGIIQQAVQAAQAKIQEAGQPKPGEGGQPVAPDPEQVIQMAAQIRQQAQQQAQAQIQQLEATPTVEKVTALLRDQRTRPFVLDIETDSTIAPDENAQKQRAAEGLTAIGGFMGQAFPLVQADPMAAPVVADLLKYVTGQYRMGREVETSIEEYADRMKERASQPQPNPEAEAAQAEAQAKAQEMQAKLQIEQQRAQADMASKQADVEARREEAAIKRQAAEMDMQGRQMETAAKLEEIGARRQLDAQKHAQDMAKGDLELRKLEADIARTQAQTEGAVIAAKVKSQQPQRTGRPSA